MEISTFLTFINEYKEAAIFLILLACGLGLPVPEDITLITGGVLAMQNSSNPFEMIIVCMFGVLIGDFIVFNLGYLFGEKVTSNKMFKKVLNQKNMTFINVFYEKYGIAFLFVGRFLPGLRMPIFLFAGIFRKVKRITFLSVDGLASVLSVPIWVLLGYHFGGDFSKLKELAQENSTLICFLITGIVIALILKKILLNKFINKEQK